MVPAENTGPVGEDLDVVAEVATANLRWVLIVGALSSLAAWVFNLVLFFETGAWQMLVVVGALLVALACLVPAALLTRRKRFRAAGYWAFSGMLIPFVVALLVHSGITIYLAIGGVLLIFVTGMLILPRQWPVWVTAAAVFGAYSWIIDRFALLPRYPMEQLGIGTELFAGGLVVFLGLAAAWGVFRTYQQIISIRVRLLVSFVGAVAFTAIVFVVVLVLVGSQIGRRQAIAQLESVSSIKEAEIGEWVENVESDLNSALIDTQAMSQVLVFLENPDLFEGDFYLWGYLQQVVDQQSRLEELMLLDLEGRVILSTDRSREGQALGDSPYFQEGLADFYLQPPAYSADRGRMVIMAVQPIKEREQVRGVLVASVNPASLNDIMGGRAWVGDTGEIYLLDESGVALTELRFDERRNLKLSTRLAAEAVAGQGSSSRVYTDYRGTSVVGVYRWLPQLRVALLAKQDISEALALTNSLLNIVGFVGLIASVSAVGIALLVTQSITEPLARLTDVSEQVAGGDLGLRAEVLREDEIGHLAKTLNSMTAQLQGLVGGLEDRVAERTEELERRSGYLEASAEVGRVASSILDPDELTREAVELIRRRFDLYYVGLFLVDESGQWAVLRAGTGDAGRAMLARDHRMRVGQGMAGWCIAHAEARVTDDVRQQEEQLQVPELPETRSEAALPLHSRGRVLGALTVQSERLGAFDLDAITALQTMADQVAVALDNARLFVESERALEAERQAYGEISREAWARLIREQPARGYRADQRGIAPLAEAPAPEVAEGDGRRIAVPIRFREQTIGVLNFRKESGEAEWTAQEQTLLEGLAEQMGQALESARLYQDTQRRAARERMIGEITTRMRETLDVEMVVRAAAQEMRNILDLAEVELRIHGGQLPPGNKTEVEG
jgi:GAF domain-containing protein/HAMP domain-containing protein